MGGRQAQLEPGAGWAVGGMLAGRAAIADPGPRVTIGHDQDSESFERAAPFSPNASVAAIEPHRAGAPTALLLPHPERIAKLDANEPQWPPSVGVRAALAECFDNVPWNWYPDSCAGALCASLSEYAGVDPAFIRVVPGVGTALAGICRAFLENDDEAIWLPPTDERWRVQVQSVGAALVAAAPESIWVPDPAAILAAITPRTRLVYLANPNNPTGTLYAQDQIASLLWSAPGTGLVVDESYHEFCGVTAIPLLAAHRNLMIIRSFAHAFGLAGLHAGYVLSHPDNLLWLDRIQIGADVSRPAQVAAQAALRDREYLTARMSETHLAMQILAAALEGLGVTVRTTPANFVLVQVADPDAVCRFLANRLIFVRNRSHLPGLRGMIRITVGDVRTGERLIAAFQAIPSALLYPLTARRRLHLARTHSESVPAPELLPHGSPGSVDAEGKRNRA